MVTTDCVVHVEDGDPPVLIVAGEVNYQSAPRIGDALKHLRTNGAQSLIVDCGAVEFMDSSGIGVVVNAAQALRKAGGGLRLRAAKPQLVHALQVSGLAGLVEIDSIVPMHVGVGRRIRPDSEARHNTNMSIPLAANMDGVVRRHVSEIAEIMPFTQDQIDDIKLAVGEAVSNAIRHGEASEGNDRLTVRCMGDDKKIVIEIHNPGKSFDPNAVPIPDPNQLKEGGMGIYFMRSTMDRVEYEFDGTGTTVLLTKYIGEK